MQVQEEWTDSGIDAFSLIEASKKQEKPFNVCFIDWKMPNVDGLETASHIRNIAGTEMDTAIDGGQAIEKLEMYRRGSYDLILLRKKVLFP